MCVKERGEGESRREREREIARPRERSCARERDRREIEKAKWEIQVDTGAVDIRWSHCIVRFLRTTHYSRLLRQTFPPPGNVACCR